MKHIPISKRRELYLHIAEEFGSNKDNNNGICSYLVNPAGIAKNSRGWGCFACKAFYEMSLFSFQKDDEDDGENEKFFEMYIRGPECNNLRSTIALFCYYMTINP